MPVEIPTQEQHFAWRKFLIAGAFLLLIATGFGLSIIRTNPQTTDTTPEGIVKKCSEANPENKEACYSLQMEIFSTAHGAEAAFALLGHVQKIDPAAQGCHFIAHGIGYGAYERDPGAWRNTFQTIDSRCTYGAMHGVLERAIFEFPEGLSATLLPDICGTAPRGSCNHIMGHIALLESEGDIDTALTLCQSLTDRFQLEQCEMGVFMENITAVNLIRHGYADASSLDWPTRVPEIETLCNSYQNIEQLACWKVFAYALAAKYYKDPTQVFTHCEQAPTPHDAFGCSVQAVSVLAAQEDFDLEKTKNLCTLKKEDTFFTSECHRQLIGSTLATVPEKMPQAAAYCAELPEEEHLSCFSTIGGILNQQIPDPGERRKICSASIPERWHGVCVQNPNQNILTAPLHTIE